MCRDNKTPHLRTYTIQYRPEPGMNTPWPQVVQAQGLRRAEDGYIELWRRLETGAEQVVCLVRSDDVLAVYEDASGLPTEVPAEWAEKYGQRVSTPPPPSDDDVPF